MRVLPNAETACKNSYFLFPARRQSGVYSVVNEHLPTTLGAKRAFLQRSRGGVWFDALLALGLSGIIALVISALLQLAAVNYRQQQDQQRLSSALTSSWSTLGYYSELAEAWAPTSSNDNSWRVDYQRLAESSRSGADCALHESSYSVGATLSNTFYIDSEDDAWHLHCDAYSKQKLIPDIANARLLYGVDLGSWAGTSFAYGAYDQQADLYLSAAEVDSAQRVVSVKVALLAARPTSPRQTPSPIPEFLGDTLAPLDASGSEQLQLGVMSYALPNAQH